MSERGLPIVDAAGACPFVAFEDERDERSTRPDHRHRCYAESRPAPRALAHQDAYCLSPAFPACPTFQDWARREAATARPPTRSVRAPASEAVYEDDIPPSPHRARDWAAPPPWMDEHGEGEADAEHGAPGFLVPRERRSEGSGLAESAALAAAGGLAGGVAGGTGGGSAGATGGSAGGMAGDSDWPRDDAEEDDVAWDAPVAGAAAAARAVAPTSGAGRMAHGPRRAGRPGATSPGSPRRSERRPDDARRSLSGPSWERPQRHEAYPTLRTRVGLPNVPGVALGFGALVVAALALFFIPPLLLKPGGTGGDAGASPAQSGSLAPSASIAPTPVPSPTQQVYVIKAGDTLSTIATQFGVSVAQIQAANKSITDPDKISIGQQIVIPSAAPSEVIDAGGGAPASPSASSP